MNRPLQTKKLFIILQRKIERKKEKMKGRKEGRKVEMYGWRRKFTTLKFTIPAIIIKHGWGKM